MLRGSAASTPLHHAKFEAYDMDATLNSTLLLQTSVLFSYRHRRTLPFLSLLSHSFLPSRVMASPSTAPVFLETASSLPLH